MALRKYPYGRLMAREIFAEVLSGRVERERGLGVGRMEQYRGKK